MIMIPSGRSEGRRGGNIDGKYWLDKKQMKARIERPRLTGYSHRNAAFGYINTFTAETGQETGGFYFVE